MYYYLMRLPNSNTDKPCSFLVGKGAREWAKEAGLSDYLRKNLIAGRCE